MKNYALIFLAVFLGSGAFAIPAQAQETVDSYFENQVKISKPEAVETKTEPDENLTAPANDDFASAETLTMGGAGTIFITRSNASASKEENEPNHADNAGGKSVWFKYTPSVTAPVEIRTINAETDFDTTLAVYKGQTMQSLVRLGSNDDCYRSDCGTRSLVRVLLSAGTTYYIAVDGYSNGASAASGTFKFIMDEQSAPFAFDNLNSAYDLGVAGAGSIGMTNHLATVQAGETGHSNGSTPGGKSVWFKIKVMSNRAMTFQMTNDFGGEMAVYASWQDSPTFADLSKVDDNADHVGLNGGRVELKFWANAAATYYVVVDRNENQSDEGATGNFQLKFFPSKFKYSMGIDDFTGQTALGVFRPSEGVWYTHEDARFLGSPKYVKFGLPGDLPMPADYMGDGTSNYAVVRNQNGLKHWYILHETWSTSYTYKQWGLATDKALVGDFDKDGRADLTVVRDTGGQLVWYIHQSTNSQMRSIVFGQSGDKPVVGDFDGDGATELAVVRASGGSLSWYILRSNNNLGYTQMSVVPFGLSSDIPAVEDYDGDGRSDIALFRPSDGTWYIHRSSTGEIQATPFGSMGDKPQPADYDNDGKSELAVFRPSQGKWYFWFSSTDSQAVKTWGLGTDVPVSSMSTLSQ